MNFLHFAHQLTWSLSLKSLGLVIIILMLLSLCLPWLHLFGKNKQTKQKRINKNNFTHVIELYNSCDAKLNCQHHFILYFILLWYFFFHTYIFVYSLVFVLHIIALSMERT